MWQGSHLDWMERSKVYRLAETKSSAPSNQFCKKCEKGFSKQNSKGHNKKYESYKRKNFIGKGNHTVKGSRSTIFKAGRKVKRQK